MNTNPGSEVREIGLPRVCLKCIYDEGVNGITFNDKGVCNYCQMIEDLNLKYETGTERGIAAFERIIQKIRKSGRGKKYDVIVGVSGGTDSSYMLHLARLYNLRVLAVHYDNTWNSAIATENIRKMTSALNIDLFTHVCDNKESDDIFRSFFLASVPEIDGPTDIALAEVLYRAAARYGLKYILEGHSFNAEGVSPLGTAYVDGGYIADIHQRFGQQSMKTFPNMTFAKFLYWTIFKRIQRVRPFWYLDYSKQGARALLESEYNWTYYGGHHLENRMTAFHHSFYTPRKFGLDQRNNSLSASVRSGELSREEALAEFAKPPLVEEEIVEYVMKRFNMVPEEFQRIMDLPRKYYTDYKTYKKRFERAQPLFYILARFNLVPWSFYIKYCFPRKINK
jgi:N-acetyl sugar amidotransferase